MHNQGKQILNEHALELINKGFNREDYLGQDRQKKTLRKLLSLRSKKNQVNSAEYLPTMMNDKFRNNFYENLIKDNAGGKTILEVGTGAGLLTLLALKYGAQHISTYEYNPLLHDKLKKLINRYYSNSNRWTLYQKSLFDCDAADLKQEYDIVLHELFSANIFGEDFIATALLAKLFLKPEGKIMPGNIHVLAKPVLFENIDNHRLIMKTHSDFSFDEFNELPPICHMAQSDFVEMKMQRDYGAELIFSIDLNSHDVPLKDSKEILIDKSIDCNALLIYFEITNEQYILTNDPSQNETHWGCLWHPIKEKSSPVTFNYNLNTFWIS
ncbi:MAG: hypothetical protein KDD38_09610 [Bdellovibrionales bacterium]|nr:hypothetical protein [Bdellovibrionales bacterium]